MRFSSDKRDAEPDLGQAPRRTQIIFAKNEYVGDSESDWTDFELLDASSFERLERWGDIILRRPDPLAIWKTHRNHDLWSKAHAIYKRDKSGGGSWRYNKKIPDKWSISYKGLKFFIEPTGFKHTGLFPEQSVNWDWLIQKIESEKRELKILNLFGYTGASTVACLYKGASVCHVDAAKGMVNRTRENISLNNLANGNVRLITDDVMKFVKREKRRAHFYDGIIMDPPSYGRGPNGELWKIEDELFDLVKFCTEIMSDRPSFFLINSYTTGLSQSVIYNILKILIEGRFGGNIENFEIGLPIKSNGLFFPCGITGRWQLYRAK